MIAEGGYQGQSVSGAYRFTIVFRRKADGWRAVISHGSAIDGET